MSLKAFHVFFLAVSLLMTLGFGVWAIRDYLDAGKQSSLYLGTGSFVVAALLAVYGVWFLKKLRNVSYV
ncbi:MAG: hypothetical protein MI923_11450 [Phycisphaerales bacterium]|nr:hypothetical protein [Phycisphaerales bacterium]